MQEHRRCKQTHKSNKLKSKEVISCKNKELIGLSQNLMYDQWHIKFNHLIFNGLRRNIGLSAVNPQSDILMKAINSLTGKTMGMGQ